MAVIGFSLLPFNVPISKERIPTNSPTRITLPRSAVIYETLAPVPRKSQPIRSSSSDQTKEEESSQKSIQDEEEVRDPGVKAALSMLKFYKRGRNIAAAALKLSVRADVQRVLDGGVQEVRSGKGDYLDRLASVPMQPTWWAWI